MEPQLLETIDFDVAYAEMFPSSAYIDNLHPVLAAYEAYLEEKISKEELGDVALTQSSQNEGEPKEISCVPYPFVFLTLIIKDFRTVDANGWFVY